MAKNTRRTSATKVASAKIAGKATQATTKNRRRKPRRTFKTYVGRVLRQTNTKLTLSSAAAAVLDSFVNHQFDVLASQAAAVARVNKKTTIGTREIQAAVRLCLPPVLAKHAIAEGSKAVARATAPR